MYVSIEVALHGVPMEWGVQLGLGEGPIKKLVQCTNPAGTIGPAPFKVAHTCTQCVLSVANFNIM